MTDQATETELLTEARRLIDDARERGIVLRLLGGLAIQLLTPELPPRTRSGQDLDFATVKASRKPLTEFLEAEGYVGDRNFNALYGDKQLYFTNSRTGLAIDVMVDRLHMCHTVHFADRADAMPYTLAPTDLLLSKLQIVELNAKDVDDILRLLISFDLVDSRRHDAIELPVIRDLVGDDWGWFKTISLNLERLRGTLRDPGMQLPPGGRLDPEAAVQMLQRTLDEAPKSRRWRMRDKVGERKRWYEVPEETPHH
ncbi:MAG: nucleotidyltransferase family protein [Solirubrobacteraceae bacterium]